MLWELQRTEGETQMVHTLCHQSLWHATHFATKVCGIPQTLPPKFVAGFGFLVTKKLFFFQD